MSAIDIKLVGEEQCDIVHRDSGTAIRSSKSPAYGGAGGTFSSTDLLAAALGSCIATNVEPVAERHGIGLDALSIVVTKTLETSPKRIAALDVHVAVGTPVEPDVLTRLARAADHCLVHRALAADLDVTIDVSGPEAGA